MPTLLGIKEFLIMEEDKMLWNHADSNIEVIGKGSSTQGFNGPW